mmetsp:Transcript_109730/g.224233  ORF Transcript_109730/g.224233 Transcript_109730/m.224233 type:complete len:125 (-) Transcript_109730:2733-3107(-)
MIVAFYRKPIAIFAMHTHRHTPSSFVDRAKDTFLAESLSANRNNRTKTWFSLQKSLAGPGVRPEVSIRRQHYLVKTYEKGDTHQQQHWDCLSVSFVTPTSSLLLAGLFILMNDNDNSFVRSTNF